MQRTRATTRHGLSKSKKNHMPETLKQVLDKETTTKSSLIECETTGLNGSFDPTSDDSSDLSSDEENSKEKLEQKRHQIKLHKLEVIKKLNLHQAAEKLRASVQAKHKLIHRPPRLKRNSKQATEPLRKSRRLQNIKVEQTVYNESMEQADEVVTIKIPADEHKLVAMTFEECADETDKEKEQRKDYEDFLKSFSSPTYTETSKDVEVNSSSLSSFLKDVKDITKRGCRSQKITEKRISCAEFYPGPERLLFAAGSTHGSVGIWDLERKDSNWGAVEFLPHTRSVRALKFVPSQPYTFYTSSYDGTLRASNLERQCLEQVVIDSEDWAPTSFDIQPPSFNVIVSGLRSGKVLLVDIRQPRKTIQQLEAHDKIVKSVSIHPVKHHYFATSSNDGKVKIFDTRWPTQKALVTIHQHSKAIDRGVFSPTTGDQLLTTCLDNRLRIFDTSELTQKAVRMVTSVQHDNHTGRWLSNFEAVWHPSREDVIMVGSMSRPRRIELYDAQLKMIHEFVDHEQLNSVCSLTCIHPTRNVFGGGNSSGRAFVFGA